MISNAWSLPHRLARWCSLAVRRGSLPVPSAANARPAASVAFAPTTPDEASVNVALVPPMFSRILTAWTLPPLSRGMLRRVVMFSPVV